MLLAQDFEANEIIAINEVKKYLLALQQRCCEAIELEDGAAKFSIDDWQTPNTIHASTRTISNGRVFEHGAVNFSHVIGENLPASATARHATSATARHAPSATARHALSASARYPQIAGATFEAMGASLIMHPHNPYAPTTHLNVRFFIARPKNAPEIWWFGGGYDLTPYYGFEADCKHWHTIAANACAPFGADVYPRFKQWCDQYFFLPHRNEPRGIGGLFFDDLNCWPYAKCFEFMQSVGNSFLLGYLPIIQRRKNMPFTAREKDFQLYRRGRYVEFNLLYDRGTLFGLQAKGRTESILASMPPNVKWQYNWQPEPGTPEAKLYSDFLRPRDWLAEISATTTRSLVV